MLIFDSVPYRSVENMRHTEEINQTEVNYERYFNETIT